MDEFRHSRARSARRRPAPAPGWLWIAVALLLAFTALLALDRWKSRGAPGPDETPAAETLPPPDSAATPALRHMAFPTPQRRLLGPDWEQGIQPTVSGRPDSGLYGSNRTGNGGYSSFHEGVDIAVVSRDARGNPIDAVEAVADGRVAYANRSAGDSNYGLYVILLHPDPAGAVYTLYAHLAAIEPAVKAGVSVTRGARLGTVGHTPSSIIPLDRAHLHFEIGLLANARFTAWARKENFKNPHGPFNGRNLMGLDPLQVMADCAQNNGGFSMLAYLQRLPPAFKLVLRSQGRMPDYFKRHPSLWTDSAPAGEAIVLTATEGGVPLSGRTATPEEAARLDKIPVAVLDVDEQVLGRNGRHLIVRRENGWSLGKAGESWLDLLLF